MSLRGRNERFTSNGAARPLRIRVHSNEPSRPCCLVNIFPFFFALPSVCFFFFFFFCYHLGAERGVCKAIFNPFHASLFHFFSLSFFLFFLTEHPSTALSSSFSSSSKSGRILVEIMQDSHPETRRGVGKNKIKPGVTRCSLKKKRIKKREREERFLFFSRVSSSTSRVANGVSRLTSDFNAPSFSFFCQRFVFFSLRVFCRLKNRLLLRGIFFSLFFFFFFFF